MGTKNNEVDRNEDELIKIDQDLVKIKTKVVLIKSKHANETSVRKICLILEIDQVLKTLIRSNLFERNVVDKG